MDKGAGTRDNARPASAPNQYRRHKSAGPVSFDFIRPGLDLAPVGHHWTDIPATQMTNDYTRKLDSLMDGEDQVVLCKRFAELEGITIADSRRILMEYWLAKKEGGEPVHAYFILSGSRKCADGADTTSIRIVYQDSIEGMQDCGQYAPEPLEQKRRLDTVYHTSIYGLQKTRRGNAAALLAAESANCMLGAKAREKDAAELSVHSRELKVESTAAPMPSRIETVATAKKAIPARGKKTSTKKASKTAPASANRKRPIAFPKDIFDSDNDDSEQSASESTDVRTNGTSTPPVDCIVGFSEDEDVPKSLVIGSPPQHRVEIDQAVGQHNAVETSHQSPDLSGAPEQPKKMKMLQKPRTYMEGGYMMTEMVNELVPVSDSEDASSAAERQTVPRPPTPQSTQTILTNTKTKKRAVERGQGSILSFFAKPKVP